MRLLSYGAVAAVSTALSIAATVVWMQNAASQGHSNPASCDARELTDFEVERLADALIRKMQAANVALSPPNGLATAATPIKPQIPEELPPQPSAQEERALDDARRLVDVMVTTKTMDREHLQRLRYLISTSNSPELFQPIVGQLLAAINRGELRPPDGDPAGWLP